MSSVLERRGAAAPAWSVNKTAPPGRRDRGVRRRDRILGVVRAAASARLHAVSGRPARLPGRRPHRPAHQPALRRQAGQPALRLAAQRPVAEVHLHAVRRALLRGRVLRAVVDPAAALAAGEPCRAARGDVVHDERAGLPGPQGPGRRRHARRRRRTAHRAGVPDHVPRADQPGPDGADHLGPAAEGQPLVDGDRDRIRRRDQARSADLHPVPAADQEVPAGRGGRRAPSSAPCCSAS